MIVIVGATHNQDHPEECTADIGAERISPNARPARVQIQGPPTHGHRKCDSDTQTLGDGRLDAEPGVQRAPWFMAQVGASSRAVGKRVKCGRRHRTSAAALLGRLQVDRDGGGTACRIGASQIEGTRLSGDLDLSVLWMSWPSGAGRWQPVEARAAQERARYRDVGAQPETRMGPSGLARPKTIASISINLKSRQLCLIRRWILASKCVDPV